MNTMPGALASAAFASATAIGLWNSTVIASECAILTGTRTHVGQTPIDESPMIFLVSLTTLFSSSVNPLESRVQSSVMTLPASCPLCAVGAGTGLPAAQALTCALKSVNPVAPFPEED